MVRCQDTRTRSRAVLAVQIESGLFARQGKAVTNFEARLPAPQSDLAQQSLKDPYVFDFLTLHDEAVERELESGLVDHIQKFLLELGAGFAFVGRRPDHGGIRSARHRQADRRGRMADQAGPFPA